MELVIMPCGDQCDWSFFESAATDIDPTADPKLTIIRSVCGPGKGFCIQTDILSPLQSEQRTFFPPKLRDATMAINKILEDVQADNPPKDRYLALLRVPDGLILAWVEHGVEVPANAVTPASPPDEIRRIIGLTPRAGA